MTESELLLALAALGVVLLYIAARVSARPRLDDGQLHRLADAAERTDKTVRDEIARMRNEAEDRGKHLRGEVREQVTGFSESLRKDINDTRFDVRRTVAQFGEGLKADLTQQIGQFNEVLAARQGALEKGVGERLGAIAATVEALTKSHGEAQEKLRASVEERLERVRVDNEQKLEQMRATVEEKLQGTLEKRLGESFALVSDRLAQVHQGLGEMQTLASGVGDLKRVLTNVKTRGTWAEVQLGALLEGILTRDQYAENVEVAVGSGQRVEFAVRLPGQADDQGPVWLPIDCKFPVEDYERLVAAQEAADAAQVELAARAVETRVRQEAKRIREKYIVPPATTDFALLYLPTEGLFAEVIRRAGLVADLQTRERVTIVGPTTLAALMNSLQMGFRTLAIQQRSSEVWRVLGEAKSEFEKYAGVWDKLSKQLQTAQNTVEEASRRTRAVSRKLRNVEALEAPDEPAQLLAFDEDGDAASQAN